MQKLYELRFNVRAGDLVVKSRDRVWANNVREAKEHVSNNLPGGCRVSSFGKIRLLADKPDKELDIWMVS